MTLQSRNPAATSGANVQDNLVGTLLRAALEGTGARRGLLILSRRGEDRIAAEATRRHEEVLWYFCDEAVTALLPESVLLHVLRARESVVIDDAAAPRFAPDSYLRQHRVKSILCLPLLNQAKRIGVLFLESQLGSGMFTPPRITLLKLVASLAASALDNSRLHGEPECFGKRSICPNLGDTSFLDGLGGPGIVTEQIGDFTVHPYYAITAFPANGQKRVGVSTAFGTRPMTILQSAPGSVYSGCPSHSLNATAAYGLGKGLWIGPNGQHIKQITDGKIDGVPLRNSPEQVGAIGPGMVWNRKSRFLYVNGYQEFGAQNRATGYKLVLRVEKIF